MLLNSGVTTYDYNYILLVLHYLESLIWPKSGKKFLTLSLPPLANLIFPLNWQDNQTLNEVSQKTQIEQLLMTFLAN